MEKLVRPEITSPDAKAYQLQGLLCHCLRQVSEDQKVNMNKVIRLVLFLLLFISVQRLRNIIQD